MLLGLQQLFTSPKALELGNKADQGLDLALLGDSENLEGFGEELLAVLEKMNPEEAKAQLELVKSQVQQANNFELVSPEKGEIISQELAQKSTQSKDSPILEQVLENDGIKKTESSLKQLFSQFVSKTTNTPAATKNVDRSPAIDFAPENIDKQLLNFEDFNQQKNAVKRTSPQVTYQGMETKKELDLKPTEIVNALPTESSGGNLQNSAHFILNTMVDSQPSSNELNLNTVKAPAPIFDAAQIKTADANVIIGQITDYIIQAKAAQEPTVNFKMNHQGLGQLDITVAKAANTADAVAINIGASAVEGKQFFTHNLKELSTHLASVGIQVSDIKIESPAQTKSDFDFNQQQKHADFGQKQFGSEQNERRQEQERRQSLWDLLSNKEAA
ncbi:MAG TPA: hypothetical protein VKZ84_02640 [Bacteriovoracaceae bacterium]|nr:hypothetical protein [Bacteriovoracaceae bacterium]